MRNILIIVAMLLICSCSIFNPIPMRYDGIYVSEDISEKGRTTSYYRFVNESIIRYIYDKNISIEEAIELLYSSEFREENYQLEGSEISTYRSIEGIHFDSKIYRDNNGYVKGSYFYKIQNKLIEARVHPKIASNNTDQYEIYNTNGILIHKGDYKYLTPAMPNHYIVTDGIYHWAIDQEGKASSKKFEWISHRSINGKRMAFNGKKFGLIYLDQDNDNAFKYDNMISLMSHLDDRNSKAFYSGERDESTFLIDSNGKEILELNSNYYFLPSIANSNPLIPIKNKHTKRIHLLDSSTGEILKKSSNKYKEILFTDEYLMIDTSTGRILTNRKGELIIPGTIMDARYQKDRFLISRANGLSEIYTTKAVKLAQSKTGKYEILTTDNHQLPEHVLFAYEDNNKKALSDENGNILTEIKYRHIGYLANGFYKLRIKYGHPIMLFNKTSGLVDLNIKNASRINENIISVQHLNGKYGLWDTVLKDWIIQPDKFHYISGNENSSFLVYEPSNLPRGYSGFMDTNENYLSEAIYRGRTFIKGSYGINIYDGEIKVLQLPEMNELISTDGLHVDISEHGDFIIGKTVNVKK